MKRRAIGVAAVVAVSVWLVLGLVPAASAAVVTGTSGVFTTSADDSNIAAGATITGYTGAGGAVAIPNTVVIGANTYNVTAIGAHAFDSKNLTSVTIPSTVTSIGDSAFDTNHSLSGVVLPAGLTSIGQGAFDQTNLGSITIPNGVTVIPFAAFDAAGLTSVDFGTGVTTIGDNAFNNNNFPTIVIPATVTSLGDLAFGQDLFLTEVDFLGAAPAVSAAGGAGSFGAAAAPLFYRWRFGSTATPAGAFTSPTWQGYNTVAIVRVSYNMNGHGAQVAEEEFQSGDSPSKPADPTASGRTFLGWFTDASLSTKFDFTAAQTSDQVVVAGWSGLAETGVAINPFAIPLAGGIVVLGALLIISARLRRRTS